MTNLGKKAFKWSVVPLPSARYRGFDMVCNTDNIYRHVAVKLACVVCAALSSTIDFYLIKMLNVCKKHSTSVSYFFLCFFLFP